MRTLKTAGIGVLMAISSAVCSQTLVSVAWSDKPGALQAREALLRSGTLEKLVEIADGHTTMRGELSVLVNDSPRSGFDPTTNTIVLSYGHWQSIRQRAAAVSRMSAVSPTDELAADAMLYAAIHQLAHAVIAQQDPATQLLGEDAVSDLSTVMLMEFVSDGARVAQNAMFLYDDTIAVAGEDPYWLDHGFSIERVWSGTCHHSSVTTSDDRAICRENYSQMVASWSPVFEADTAIQMLQTAASEE